MSEYQYYEFLAIDKPLTATEKSALGQLSSRVKVRVLPTVTAIFQAMRSKY
jgi:hypothetical protein